MAKCYSSVCEALGSRPKGCGEQEESSYFTGCCAKKTSKQFSNAGNSSWHKPVLIRCSPVIIIILWSLFIITV